MQVAFMEPAVTTIQPVIDVVKTPEQQENQQIAEPLIYREALALWYRVTLQGVQSNSYDLSNRQMAILLTLFTEDHTPHTVRSLAFHLSISKPAVCRALDTLSKYDLATRNVDLNDRRNVFISLTDNGRNYLRKFSAQIMNCLSEIE